MSKRVIVAGGSGYIGSVLVPRLLSRGHQVVVIDLMIFDKHSENSLMPHSNLVVVPGDINNDKLVNRLMMCAPDVVVNLASVPDNTGDAALEKIGKSTNFDACIQLAMAAKGRGVPLFVYASSSSIYGNREIANTVDENQFPAPSNNYARFKYYCENRLAELKDDHFGVCCVRATTVFGKSPRQRFDLLINNMTMTSCVANKVMVAGEDCIRPQIHVDDIADLYIKIIEAPTEVVAGEVFNAADNNLTIGELSRKVTDTLKNVAITKVVCKTEDRRSFRLSSEKALRILNFRPSFSLERAIELLAAGINGGLYDKPMENRIYFNKDAPGFKY